MVDGRFSMWGGGTIKYSTFPKWLMSVALGFGVKLSADVERLAIRALWHKIILKRTDITAIRVESVFSFPSVKIEHNQAGSPEVIRFSPQTHKRAEELARALKALGYPVEVAGPSNDGFWGQLMRGGGHR